MAPLDRGSTVLVVTPRGLLGEDLLFDLFVVVDDLVHLRDNTRPVVSSPEQRDATGDRRTMKRRNFSENSGSRPASSASRRSRAT